MLGSQGSICMLWSLRPKQNNAGITMHFYCPVETLNPFHLHMLFRVLFCLKNSQKSLQVNWESIMGACIRTLGILIHENYHFRGCLTLWMLGNFLKKHFKCRLLFKTSKICLCFMGYDSLSGKPGWISGQLPTKPGPNLLS